MKITIHKAHGEVLAERKQQMNQLVMQFETFRMEDKRTTDAIVKVAGFDPSQYSDYKLLKEGDAYYLELVEKEAKPAPEAPASAAAMVTSAPEPVKHVNGAA
jgi:hypothetical protein